MSYQQINQHFIQLLKKYDLDLQITFINDVNQPKVQVSENEPVIFIQINQAKVNMETYLSILSHEIREILLPKLSIETNRLILRHYQEKDADDLFEFCSDQQSCYMDGGYEPFLEKNETYYRVVNSFKNDKTRFIITLKETDQAIGMLNLMPCNDRVVSTYELGYIMNPSQRKKGYLYESAFALLNFLFDELYLEMVIAGAIEENQPSLHVLEKLGFIYEGRKHKAFSHPIEGAIDLLYYYKERGNKNEN